jgi:hypothetical protein
VADGKIVAIEAIADRVRLRQLDLAVLEATAAAGSPD